MSKVVIMAHGGDPYDHDNMVQYDTHQGTFEGEEGSLSWVSRNDYLNHCKKHISSSNTGWMSLWELDMRTGVSKCWFQHANPVRVRQELNLKAKELKVTKPKMKTASLWGMAPPPSVSDFTSSSLDEILNSLNAQVSQQV